jgi:hypothetical protein
MRRPEAGILALSLFVACAIPTEAPSWDMTWNLPVPDNGTLNVGVGSFVPPGVTIDSSATPRVFVAGVSSVPSIVRTLGADCPSCPSATAPKPAFTAPLATSTITLVAGSSLTSGTIASGSQLIIAITNGFQFDPIKPPGGTAGTITFTLDNGGLTVGNPLVISGSASAIPPGQTTTFTMPLSGVISSSSPLTVKMTMDSPAGSAAQPVTMSPTQPFTAAITSTLRLSTATVTIGAQAVKSGLDTLDMSGMSNVKTRVRDTTGTEGSMMITLTSPFTVGGSMNITFSKPPSDTGVFAPIVKTLFLQAATSATTPKTTVDTISFSGTELRTILGRKVIANFGGNTAAGSLTVTPIQKITMSSRMQLTFSYKESK